MVIIPKNYESKLTLYQTQTAIGQIKNIFQKNLSKLLNLKRVTAPLFVLSHSGLNDGLNGEEPVRFYVKNIDKTLEIVHSLAKWKRMALYEFDFKIGNGLYTDMNAIRKEEVLDNTHSFYVDQWDFEKVINKEDRNINYLKEEVRKIVKAIYLTANSIYKKYPKLGTFDFDEVYFIKSSELLKKYPHLSPDEREYEIVKEKGCVFVIGIGDELDNGYSHGERAADYDDWSLNGDLIYYHETLDVALELSSMGIRVDKDSLYYQLSKRNKLEDLKFDYHKLIMENKLPLSFGGGIGQSRLCMLILKKAHIGEVQSSVWDEKTYQKLNNKIKLV